MTILDLHLALSNMGLSGRTRGCPSSGTVLLASSHHVPKQAWPHTLQSDRPRKPLGLATLAKVIGCGRAPAPTAAPARQQKHTVGRNPSQKRCKPPFLLLPWWRRVGQRNPIGLASPPAIAPSPRALLHRQPLPCSGTWGPPPTPRVPRTSTREPSKRGEGVAVNLYLAPKETFPEPPPPLSIQGVGFGAETLGFCCYCTPRGLRRGSRVSRWWGRGRGLMDEGIAGSGARELGRLRQSYCRVVGAK